jgi:IS5 family transposase
MRKVVHQQPPLFPVYIEHSRADELRAIGEVLDETPGLYRFVQLDLCDGIDPGNGRAGMCAEQVLRCAIAQKLEQWTFDQLAFHLADSQSFKAFCRIGIADDVPKKSTLHENISKISARTWRIINRMLVGQAAKDGIEKGRKVRFDCTVTETDVHFPTDALLCVDLIRVACRILQRLRDDEDLPVVFRDHQLRSRRRANNIRNRRKGAAQTAAYEDLLKVMHKTRGYLEQAHQLLAARADIRLVDDLASLAKLIRQADAIIDQTTRRVLLDEKVPADEKIYSIFEEHTDIIIKKRREVEFGHKLCLAVGASSLVLDVTIEDGNPADSQLAQKMVERQISLFRRPPRQVAFDGGFTSRENVEALGDMGVSDIAFHKKRGLKISEMVKSSWVYKRLKHFRAGIEGIISWLKRCFGLTRCNWRGLDGFKRYVWSSVVAANVLTLARHRIGARSG